MTIKIEKMQEEDIDEVYEMFVDLYEHLNQKGFVLKLNTDNLKDLIKVHIDSNFLKIFLVKVNGEVCGFINVNLAKVNSKFKVQNSKYVGNITELFVKKAFRGNSLGKLLIDEAKKFLKTYDVEYVQVNTMVKNVKAVNFYLNQGFQEDYISFIDNIVK